MKDLEEERSRRIPLPHDPSPLYPGVVGSAQFRSPLNQAISANSEEQIDLDLSTVFGVYPQEVLPETLNVLIAPEEMLARALNGNPDLQQFMILFVTSIRSGVLSKLDRSSIELIVRRAFTPFQLMTILEENHHPFRIAEHFPWFNAAGFAD